MKIVLINACPRAGKDTLAVEIRKTLKGRSDLAPVIIDKFAYQLKLRTHYLYGIREGANFFEDVKDDPCEEMLGVTPRQAYIAVSEQLMKPLHGKDIFGKLLVKELEHFALADDQVVLIPDSGFAEEARVLVDRFGAQNVYLVRLLRPGTDFSRDSRSHLEPEALGIPAANFLVLRNEGTRESVRMLADHVVEAFDL